jgi:hypothetical protein
MEDLNYFVRQPTVKISLNHTLFPHAIPGT